MLPEQMRPPDMALNCCQHIQVHRLIQAGDVDALLGQARQHQLIAIGA